MLARRYRHPESAAAPDGTRPRSRAKLPQRMKFKVMLRGENFNVALDGPVAKLGFYTTRFVEADTPDAAEQAAVDVVRQDSRLQGIVRNAPTDPPMIYLESLSEIPSFDGCPVPGAGYTWFSDDVQDQRAL